MIWLKLRSISDSPSSAFLTSTPTYVNRKWTFHILGHWIRHNRPANRLYKSKNAEQCKCGSAKADGKRKCFTSIRLTYFALKRLCLRSLLLSQFRAKHQHWEDITALSNFTEVDRSLISAFLECFTVQLQCYVLFFYLTVCPWPAG